MIIEEVNEEEAKLLDEKKKNSKAKPEIEVELYVKGKGPIHVFRTPLVGWDQDRIDLLHIMEEHGFKALYAFNPNSGRGLRLRFNPRNGLSLLPYHARAVRIDGEPKDSLLMPISRVLLLLAFLTLALSMILRDPPEWVQKLKFLQGDSFPWTWVTFVVVLIRLRKRFWGLLWKFRR
eukprot:TRINITY_DN24161_c0_g1_i1.p1 TRINITY_DN24161_c0_g1~~TRINITY_DN24161_c0_g1_i1.p1  ORF type:complete len:177 (-),score=21.71 TRINITY_DN24161_c0_g1_i1:318-848(-)